MNIVEQYLIQKSVEYKIGPNEELIAKGCQFCGDDKWHCYINSGTGLVHCKKCCGSLTGNKRGYNFNQLREKYGDEPIKLTPQDGILIIPSYKRLNIDIAYQAASRLRNTPDIMAYLMFTRMLSDKVIKEYQLGWEGNYITIPMFENNILTNICYRFNPLIERTEEQKKYKMEAGAKPILFNVDCLKKKPNRVVITEGMLDALLLLSLGVPYVVSVPLGASYFNKAWASLFQDIKEVFLCYDNDAVGQQGAKLAAQTIGVKKCKNILLPEVINENKVKDVTNYFIGGGTLDSYIGILSKAAEQEIIDTENPIRTLSSFKGELIDMLRTGNMKGYMTGMNEFDQTFGGLKKGHLIVLSGLPGTGKTAIAQNIAYNITSVQKVPVFFFSLEMTPIDIVKRYVSIASDLKGAQLETKLDEDTLQKVVGVFDVFKNVPLLLFNGDATLTIEKLRELIIQSIKEHKTEVVFIDHLHYFSQSVANKSSEIGNIVRGIRNIARDLNIPIVLLCHLNRSGRSQQKTGMYVPALSDLKDSSGIEQDASEVVFICRDTDSEVLIERQKVILKIAKNRDGQVGSVLMRYIEDKLTFESMPSIEIGGTNTSTDYTIEHIDF